MSLLEGSGEANTATAGTTEGSSAVTEAPATEPPDSQWLYAEGVPGTGDRPEYFKADKYGTLADQAKAYKELEVRFGSFTGAPESYEINLSEELSERGVEFTEDDPLYQEALEFAKASNMNQEGFDKMINLYASAQVAQMEALEQFKLDQMAQLGDNAKARVANLDNWAKANLPGDLYEGFKEMVHSAPAVKALEQVVAMTRNAPVSPDNVQAKNGVTAEEVQKMQFEKDEYGNRRIQTDPAFRARYNKLKEQVWGSENHRIVINP